ncbi:MAG: DUF429 domain-containing protein [Microcella sp.]|uniref:DUF429 domain-containing protein n=1 Tax=Microcella sp. TaxID=1913979 RepID=UPI003314DB64
MFRTAGVDLAAESAHTGLAIIEWRAASARVSDLQLGVGNDSIVNAAAHVELVGIDCAFGWPDDFVDVVAALRDRRPLDADATGDIDWRRRLAYRDTDRAVKERTGRWPLSVATDRLGLTALRCAVILEAVARAGLPVDRAGSPPSRVVEVYPAAALRCWGLRQEGYKRSEERRAELLDAVLAALPWLELGEHRAAMLRSADAFDAVLSAVIAGFAHVGRIESPPPEAAERVSREGWIALPVGEAALIPSTSERFPS